MTPLRPRTQCQLASYAAFLIPLLACACHSQEAPSAMVVPDAGVPVFDAGVAHFCDLPGSLQYTALGQVQVPGLGDPPTLKLMHLPPGFCAHFFANVSYTRQMRFAPGGELFVASPGTATTSHGDMGKLQAIEVLPDDNRDGYADSMLTFLGNLASTQGLLFTKDYLYYQDDTKILRVPYKAGDRAPSGAAEMVADITYYSFMAHWPKNLDQADDGSIYVSNGGDQNDACVEPHPFHGGILKLDGTPDGTQIAQGFRNPIALRCEHGKNLCFAAELALDYSGEQGGREKLVPIRAGDDWGFPCCATKGQPYADPSVTPDCSGVAAEDAAFLIGDTPFGFDFEPGKWPAPYAGSAFVALHGAAGDWSGARVVMIAVDPQTGLLMPSDDLQGNSTGAMTDFATGWDDGKADVVHGRPTALTFAPDGRMFLGDDTSGDIFWIAPLDLPR